MHLFHAHHTLFMLAPEGAVWMKQTKDQRQSDQAQARATAVITVAVLAEGQILTTLRMIYVSVSSRQHCILVIPDLSSLMWLYS